MKITYLINSGTDTVSEVELEILSLEKEITINGSIDKELVMTQTGIKAKTVAAPSLSVSKETLNEFLDKSDIAMYATAIFEGSKGILTRILTDLNNYLTSKYEDSNYLIERERDYSRYIKYFVNKKYPQLWMGKSRIVSNEAKTAHTFILEVFLKEDMSVCCHISTEYYTSYENNAMRLGLAQSIGKALREKAYNFLSTLEGVG